MLPLLLIQAAPYGGLITLLVTLLVVAVIVYVVVLIVSMIPMPPQARNIAYLILALILVLWLLNRFIGFSF